MYRICEEIKPEEKEMREVFAQVMDELTRSDSRVVYLDADIINSIKMTAFSKKYPQRTINCGIQEANMIGVAAGISETGLIPFAHTFAPFATRRVMDQIFVSVAYANLNVRIIGSDPGITAGSNGGTHIPFEDMGMMRCIPNATILEPADSIVLADMLRQTKDLYGLYYIRLSRKKSEQIYQEGSTFTIGKSNLLREGNDVTVIASGICVADACKAADELLQEGIKARVIDMFTIKPIDREAIILAAKETEAIVTIENHNIMNGLGSAVAEVMCEEAPACLVRLGAQDRFGEVGTVDYLKKVLHMSVEDIKDAARKAIAKKKYFVNKSAA